jgi:hypothetical protein
MTTRTAITAMFRMNEAAVVRMFEHNYSRSFTDTE